MSSSLLAPVVDSRRLIATVRAVFEHAGFVVTVPLDRPEGVDLLVQAPGAAAPFAVLCVADPSHLSAGMLMEMLANCRTQGVAKVQILSPLRCSPGLHAAAAHAQADLVDGEQFAAALRTLPPEHASRPEPEPEWIDAGAAQPSPPEQHLSPECNVPAVPVPASGQATGGDQMAVPASRRWGNSLITSGLGIALLIGVGGLATVFLPGSGRPVPVTKPAQGIGRPEPRDAESGNAEPASVPPAGSPSPVAPEAETNRPETNQAVRGLEVDCQPILIPANAATSASEVKPEFVRELQRTANLERIDDPNVLEFANFLIESGGQFAGADVERLRPAAEDVLRQAERYPVLAYYAVPCQRDQTAAMEELLPILEKAGDAVKIYHGRSLRAYHTRREKDAEDALRGLQSMLQVTKGLRGLSAPAAINVLFHPYAKGFWAMHHGQIAAILHDEPGVEPWFKELVMGEHYFLAAREARRPGAAASASGKASGAYEGFLRQAGECCERSWAAKPHPRSASLLIAVCEGISDKPKEEMRIWFDAAVGLRADYHAAYRTYLEGIQPSRRGSDAELAAFGKACLNTGRYDLGVPDHLLEAHRLRAKEGGAAHWRSLNEEEISGLAELFDGFERSGRDVSSRAWDRSIAAAVWFAAGQEEKLAASLRLVNFEVDPAALQWLGVSPADFDRVTERLKNREQAGL